jgi:hypothetical protein
MNDKSNYGAWNLPVSPYWESPEVAIEGSQRVLEMVGQPTIHGPTNVSYDKNFAQYSVRVKVWLPAADTWVCPEFTYGRSEEYGPYVDVRWTSENLRTPSGIWERTLTFAVPRRRCVMIYGVLFRPSLKRPLDMV